MVEFTPKTIETRSLELDPDNPRFYELRYLRHLKNPTQEHLLKLMKEDKEILTLIKAIKRSGVAEPIWVKEMPNGKYLVIEGNRRTYILKRLLQEKAVPRNKNVRYDRVKANVLPSDISETELLLQRARLQTGKKDWGAFNEAATTYNLRHQFGMEEEDIADDLQISVKRVKERMENYNLLLAYADYTKNLDPHKFSFFSEANKKVKDWFNDSDENLEDYFKIITKNKKGIQKIRSVATKGGLRDFQHVIDHQQTLSDLIKSPTMTTEEALEIVKSNNIGADLPFLSRIGPLAGRLASLTEEELEKVRQEDEIVRNVKRMYRVCQGILKAKR